MKRLIKEPNFGNLLREAIVDQALKEEIGTVVLQKPRCLFRFLKSIIERDNLIVIGDRVSDRLFFLNDLRNIWVWKV